MPFLERPHDDAKVIITIGMEGERSVVTIADNGGGVPEEIKDRVFVPSVKSVCDGLILISSAFICGQKIFIAATLTRTFSRCMVL